MRPARDETAETAPESDEPRDEPRAMRQPRPAEESDDELGRRPTPVTPLGQGTAAALIRHRARDEIEEADGDRDQPQRRAAIEVRGQRVSIQFATVVFSAVVK